MGSTSHVSRPTTFLRTPNIGPTMDLRCIAVFLFFCLLAGPALAGGADPEPDAHRDSIATSHRVVGYVKCQGRTIPSAEIMLYDENELVMWTEVGDYSRFELNLPSGTYCTVEVSAPGYHPKRVGFDTRTNGRSSITYRFKVEMISMLETSHHSDERLHDMDYPAALVMYTERTRRFEEIEDYAQESQGYFAKLLKDGYKERFSKVRVKQMEAPTTPPEPVGIAQDAEPVRRPAKEPKVYDAVMAGKR